MRTSAQYLAKLKGMRKNVHLGGEVVERDDPRLVPGTKVISMTFDLVDDPKFKDLLTAESHLTGETINRFCHIHQSSEDLMKKQEMTRLLCQKSGGCIQRCMGVDVLNALSVVTFLTDMAHSTEYHQRFLDYLRQYQENDWVANCAQTDVKGDRSKRPHEQVDPDLYLRVIEKRQDGMVVRGAKAHNTMAPYADEIIVVPTRFMGEKDKDYAVAFAIPADTEGLHLVCRSTTSRPRKHLKTPSNELGVADSFTIFDDVFVPWERVFMCGEYDQAGYLAGLFAAYHRHSYTGCKPATTDVMMGAAALVAEYNGVAKAPHVRDKLAEMITVAELVYGAGIAAAVKSQKAPSGTQVPDFVFVNAGRYHAGVNIYHEFETVAEIAGGLPATLPSEEDFFDPTVGPLLNKYIRRNPAVSSEDQHRLFRLISDMIVSAAGGVAQVAGVHGGGSPIMEKIALVLQYDMDSKKQIVKELAGIK
ncbi:MAG: 4-hydroxyphenylacetate 3-hydroxylase family protein [Bacillota bacterium]